MNRALDFTLDDVPELNPDPAPLHHDPRLDARTQRFIAYLHRGGAERFTQDRGKPSAILWSRTDEALRLPADHTTSQIFFSISPATQRVTDEDRAKHPGLTDKAIESRVATKAGTVAAINCLYREFDGKDFCNPTDSFIDAIYQPMRVDPANAKIPDKALRNQATGKAKSAIYKNDPAQYKALALAAVRAMNPAPSIVVASGGGYNAYCLLDQPFIIRTSEHDHAAHVQSYAEDMQRRFVHMDKAADQGVHDLRRVFRPPGTTNHKPAYGPNFPVVSFETFDMDRRYRLDELIAVLPAVSVAAPSVITARPAHNATTAPQRTNSREYTGNSPIAAYNAAHAITEVLEANGYTKHGSRYMRPGGDASPGVDIDVSKNRARHWSSNDPMYSVFWRSPFDVFCTYNHNGSVRAAVAAAAVELGMVRPPVDVTPTIDVLRLWIKTRNLADLLPAGPGRLKVRLVVDAILDLMEKDGRVTVTAGKRRLAALAGVSANTVKNVLALVNDRIFDVKPSEYGDEITLVSKCRLTFFDPLLEIVKGLTTGGQKTENDKNEYSAHKTDDEFATGMSRYVRERLHKVAQVLEITYPQAKTAYSKPGLGEGVLLAFDTWQRVGDFSAQEFAEETGVKLAAARAHLRRAETMGLAESAREGSRGPKVYTFASNFWEKINELAPHLRTHRLSDQRENKRLEAAQQWAHRGETLATTPEEKQPFAQRFAKLAKQRLPHLASLHPELSSTDIKRLAYEITAYRRSPQTEQVIRTERTAQRTEHRETVALIRDLALEICDINTPRAEVFAAIMKFGTFDERTVKQVLQSSRQMAAYETVESIRSRLRHDELTQALVIVPPPAPVIDYQLRMLAGI